MTMNESPTISPSSAIPADSLYQFTPITANQLSPDGRLIAYTVQRIDRKTEKKYSDLWLVATDGESPPRRLTFGDHVHRLPKWSADGSQIAFLSNRDGETMQLYVLPMNGGEARPITHVKGSLEQFAWSPDGRAFALVVSDPDPQEEAREEDPDKKELGIVCHHITRVFYKANGAGILPQTHTHLWRVERETGEMSRLTEGDYDVSEVAWSPDGARLVFVANVHPDPDFHPDAMQLYAIPSAIPAQPLSRDQFTQLTDHPGTLGDPVYAPNGQQIAFYGYEKAEGWYQNSDLFVVSADGGAVRNLSGQHDVDVGSNTSGDVAELPTMPPLWSADSTKIYTQISRHGRQPLVEFHCADGAMRVVVEGVVGLAQLSADQQTLAYLRNSADSAGQLWVRDMVSGAEKQLTQQNRWWHELPPCQVEMVWFTARDGYRLQGWIMRPADFDPTRRYPTLIEIHGGPQTQYGETFMHEFHYLASHGYVVAFCNPRGGQGYGLAHCQAIHGRWGTVDYEDVIDFSDYVAALPYVNEKAMGVTGGSYGGLMTSWIIGRTHRFRGAVVQRPVTNWFTMWGACDFNYLWTRLAGDPHPWQDFEKNWHTSPMSEIENAKTPTLIIQGLEDMRTPNDQAEQLFVALKVLGVPAELVLFPNETHELSRSGRTDRRVARLEHLLRWFDRWVKPE